MSIEMVGSHQINPAAQARITVQQRPERAQTNSAAQSRPKVSIDTVISELTSVSAAFNRRLSFSVNEKLDQVVVKVIDVATDKVIREIPPEDLQHVHERIREVLGLLFDEKV